MRRGRLVLTTACCLAALVLLPLAAAAEETPTKKVAPLTPQQAADAVLKAIAAQDDDALRSLAEKVRPDPWLVAEELVCLAELEAALALAGAAPTRATARLAAYVESQGERVRTRAGLDALAVARTALSAGDAKQAWATLTAAEVEVDTVVGVLILDSRARLLHQARKFAEAGANFEAAAEGAHRLGWLARCAAALVGLGSSRYARSDWAGARDAYDRCLEIHESLGDRVGALDALERLARVHRQQRNAPEAIRCLRKAIAAHEASGNLEALARSLMTLGLTLTQTKQFDRALEVLQRAKTLFEDLGDQASVARALANVGLVYRDRADPETAFEWLARALRVAEESKLDTLAARFLIVMGELKRDSSDREAALEYFERAYRVLERAGQRVRMAECLTNLGRIHMLRGEGEKAVAHHERALQLAESEGDLHMSSVVLRNYSEALGILGEWGRALAQLEQALAVDSRRGDARSEGDALRRMAALQLKKSDFAKALDSVERSHAKYETTRDAGGLAHACLMRADILSAMARYEEALASAREALAIQESRKSHGGVTDCAGTLAQLCIHTGAYREAIEYAERALEGCRRESNRPGVGNAHGNLALALKGLGRYREALEHQRRSLEIAEEVGNRGGVARALTNLANTLKDMGEYAAALEIQEKALSAFERLGSWSGQAATLGNIGNLYYRLGDFERALAFEKRALGMKEAIGDRAGMARGLDSIGNRLEALGRTEEAIVFHQRAIALNEEIGSRAGIATNLLNLGGLYRGLSDPERALELLDRALALATELDNVGLIAQAHLEMAATHRRAHHLSAARTHVTQCLDLAMRTGDRDDEYYALLESTILAMLGDDNREAIALARRAIDLLPHLAGGQAEEVGASARARYGQIFELGLSAAAELGHATEFLFFLESGRAGTLLETLGGREQLAQVTVPERLREEERAARNAERLAVTRYQQSRADGALKQIRLRKKELSEAHDRVKEVVERIQRSCKAAGDLVYPRAASLERIRSTLREGDALVLYAALEKMTGALVVDATSCRIVALAPTPEITAACEDWLERRETRTESVDPVPLRRLLVDPLGLDSNARRVLLSVDGPLAFVPVGTLFTDRDAVYVPSATTYCTLMEASEKRGRGVLALGDPTYPDGGLSRLPATRKEVEALGDTVLLGESATEGGLFAALGERSRWRAVHLACHGLVDPDRPTLSSLALAPDAQNDGRLTCLEIFRTPIPADLVVLSACETARGTVYRAEGIVGLTRAFMLAGAPRVVCSLWKVDDEATRALMIKFYELWNPRARPGDPERPKGVDGAGPKGMDAATALRAAQDYVRSHEQWKHPHYWAAWVLWGLPE